MNTPARITIWPKLRNPEGRPVTIEWEKLFEQFSERIDFEGDNHAGWSPAHFDGDKRALAGVSDVEALVLDVDGGWDIQSATEAMSGLYGLIHTSKSHTVDTHRFRIVLPLLRPVTADEYREIWRRFDHWWPARFDPQAKDASRFWYLPGVKDESTPFEAIRLTGSRLDPDDVLSKPLPEPEHEHAPTPAMHEAGSDERIERRAIAYLAKMPPAISGQRGHDAAWAAACALARGFGLSEWRTLSILRTEYNPRCQPPWSEKELAHKARHAANNSTREVGYLLKDDNFDAPHQAFDPGPPPPAWEDDSERLPGDDSDEETEREPAWVRYGVLTMRSILQDVHSRCFLSKPAPSVSTGNAELDKIIGGYRPKKVTIMGATTSWGKALREDEPVLTPDGWKAIGDLSVGDKVIGRNGRPCRVTGVFPQGQRELFRVTLWDGATILADGDHLWAAHSRSTLSQGKPPPVLTTREIAAMKSERYVPLCAPVEFDAKTYLIDPYTLGALLGDGSFRSASITVTTDREIVDRMTLPAAVRPKLVRDIGNDVATFRLSSDRGQPNELLDAVRTLGLLGLSSHEKHIPEEYFWGSIDQRLALLRGLLDTDGHVQTSVHSVTFSSASRALAEGVRRLVLSLGGLARVTTKAKPTFSHNGEQRVGRPAHRVVVRLPSTSPCPLLLRRKASAWSPRLREPLRRIMSIEPAGVGEAVCIRVDAQDHLFVTRDFAVTHNSTFAIMGLNFGLQCGKRVLLVSAEDDSVTYGKRIMAERAGVSALKLRDEVFTGKDGQVDLTKMASVATNAEDVPWFIDGVGKPVEHLANAVYEIATEGEYELVIIDYIQAFQLAKRTQDRRNDVTQVARLFIDAIKNAGAAGLILSQFKRLESPTKEPTKFDLKESGDLENMAEHIILGWVKNDAQHLDADGFPDDSPGVSFDRVVKVAKNKDGPIPPGCIALPFNTKTASFRRTAPWPEMTH